MTRQQCPLTRLSHLQNSIASFLSTFTTGWSSVCGKPQLSQVYFGSCSNFAVRSFQPIPPAPFAGIGSVSSLVDETAELSTRDLSHSKIELTDPHHVLRFRIGV